jgi:hypothetical protein
MAYLHSSEGDPISYERLRAIANTVDLVISNDDLDALSTAVRDQLASVKRLERLDLNGIAPVLRFDPRWHD